MSAGRADEAKEVVTVSKRGDEGDEFEIELLEVTPSDSAMWGIPSFCNVNVHAWQEGDDVVVRVEEKAFLPMVTQKRMSADISLIGRVHEGMLAKDIAAYSSCKSLKVPSTVAVDCFIGGGQHMHCGHSVTMPSQEQAGWQGSGWHFRR